MKRLRKSVRYILFLITGLALLLVTLSLQSPGAVESTCSYYATQRGPGQKIISYSYFGPIGEKGGLNWYAKGLLDNAQLIPKYYGHDFVMRVYHDEIGQDMERYNFLKSLAANYEHVDLCYIGTIPKYGNLKEALEPTTWRFLPLGDPLVQEVHSRDLDSRPSERELAAVREFQADPTSVFHVMRDHRQHHALVLAGLWGAKWSTTQQADLVKGVLISMFEELAQMRASETLNKYSDQVLLQNVLVNILDGIVLAHDSYNCGFYSFKKTVPWPTQREEEPYNFVGAQMFGHVEPYLDPCPPPCRPKDHKDWRYC